MSELREMMRELQVSQPTRVYFSVQKPNVWARLVWDDLGGLDGLGGAHCHPNDTFDRPLGIEIAYGRAVKDAAQKLLEMTRGPEWAESEDGGEEMGLGYLCFQCEAYEQSRRNETVGICHEGNPYLVRGGRPGCPAFRLYEGEPPEDAGEVVSGTLETFAEAPGLEDRVEALESKVADLDTEARAWIEGLQEECTELRSQATDLTVKVDGLERETRMLTKRVGKLEALERLDEKRLTRLEQESDAARGRIERLEEVSHDHMA